MNGLYVAGFGVVGVLARYYADLIGARWYPSVPWATFFVNVFGCAIAGLVWALGTEREAIPESIRVGLLAGFCGGFTTFSAYCLQSLLLVGNGQRWSAALYLALSPPVGFAAAWAGVWAGRAFAR